MPIDTVTVAALWIDNLSDLLCHNEEVVCDFCGHQYRVGAAELEASAAAAKE